MPTRALLTGSFVSVALLIGACGGGTKPAAAPDARADETTAAAPEAGGKTESDKADAAKPEAGKDAAKPTAPADDGPKPTRTAQDILTAPDVVFLFDFNESEPKHAAEEKCTKKAGDNPKKMNECMAGERKAFPADG